MSFDELLDRIWGYDFEVTAHDWLLVLKDYRTRKRVVFHNSIPNDVQNFIDMNNPILMGYNNNGYDKYILKAILSGYTPEEIKEVSDHIIGGGNGWELDLGYAKVPTQIDLINCIVPRKSLKELEGNLRMNITESTIDFNIKTKWNKQEYDEMLYYCDHDVDALFPIFDMLMTRFKSKYIVAKICNIDVEKAMSLTDANLTALALCAEKQEHNDQFLYEFPDVIDKNKIPKEFLDYIQMCREHNDDYNYIREHPMKPLYIDGLEIQVQLGGIHGFPDGKTICYGENEVFRCE
jgi:hypothetical protein